MALQESGEMYLEIICILSLKGTFVRSIDVAEYMGFSKPSVSRGLGLLKQGGYLTADRDACRIEHVNSNEPLRAICLHAKQASPDTPET